jgi:hypothetical protein
VIGQFRFDAGNLQSNKEDHMKYMFAAIVLVLPFSALVFAQTTVAADGSSNVAPVDGFCIMNATPKTHLFATETREGERQLETLVPGASLCVSGTAASDGIVSVFENADGFEGCSRIIQVGTTEAMLEYAEFDRCGWSSHKS